MAKGSVKYTPSQKDDMVRRVDARREKGLSLEEACKAENVHKSLYHWWKARQKGLPSGDRGTNKPSNSPRAIGKLRDTIKMAIDDVEGPSKPLRSSGSLSMSGIMQRLWDLKSAMFKLEEEIMRMSSSDVERDLLERD